MYFSNLRLVQASQALLRGLIKIQTDEWHIRVRQVEHNIPYFCMYMDFVLRFFVSKMYAN
jgi:hypothetical protein